MYELVWQNTGFRIIRRGSEAKRSVPESLPLKGVRTKSQLLDPAVWKQFVRTGTTDSALLAKPIQNSWLRCQRMGVDPAFGKCHDIRSESEFSSEHLQLRDLTLETKDRLYDLVQGQGMLVTISDRNGILVTMCGDYRTLASADKLCFGPGADWSEKSVGTNAIGTALTEGRALQVAGAEHFCEGHHKWICTAAPVFNLQGEVIGCLDISGPKSLDHSRIMALVMKGARAIERELFRQQAMELEHHTAGVITSMMHAVTTGLVLMDAVGSITAVNPAAQLLLGKQADALTGMRAENFFDLGRTFEKIRTNPNIDPLKGVSISFRKHPEYPSRAFAVTSPNGALSGLLLVIHEPQRVRTFIPIEKSERTDPFSRLLGHSPLLEKARVMARRVAATPVTVLVTGDSGTGKEVIARAMHDAGPRNRRPFIAVNCGAIPSTLIQSELFGYEDGAFTGARKGGAPGKFEQASGGTLFLDEIAEMPIDMQVNLLRVLEAGALTRVGGAREVPVDVRIITATNKNLEERVGAGRFREDLFYRLNVVRIDLPPLCRRLEDVELLARHFIECFSKKLDRPVHRVASDFFEALRRYSWPGNVRELRHAIEGAVAVMPGDELSLECLPKSIRGKELRVQVTSPSKEVFNLETVERETILKAHHHFDGNVTRMAKALGIGRNTLYSKMKRQGLVNISTV
jgi:sigma-54 dependent transcriptional regulator, acetoin dehydrogenase operon transcriptional activator AcoR